MSRMKPFTGRYGRLVVIGRPFQKTYGTQGKTVKMVECKCDCGRVCTTSAEHLRNGKATSCGCYRTEFFTTHGQSETREYWIWSSMIQRCTNPENKAYPKYGGRGITVHKRWLSFENFIKDMGQRPSESLSLDRLDNNKGYSKSNCKWRTDKQQCRNTRRNHFLTHKGKTRCLAEWGEVTGIKAACLRARLKRGWSIVRALETPKKN
jgi:hypothetical protein